jgi:hypothetical protein
MNYKENTPTFNVNRKVVNFKDFLSDPKGEETDLKKVRRSTKPNSEEQQHIGNSRYKFNKTTRKMDDLSPAEIDDSIEDIEGTNEGIFSDRLKDDEFSQEDKKIEIWNSITDMTQDRYSPKLDKWINSLSEEELNIIYNSIEKNDLLSKFSY